MGRENKQIKAVLDLPETEHTRVIHTIPAMTDAERDAAKKRIGSDLYEIFMRIQAELNLDSESTQK